MSLSARRYVKTTQSPRQENLPLCLSLVEKSLETKREYQNCILRQFVVLLLLFESRAVAHSISFRLPTTESRIRVLVSLCTICGGQSGTEAGSPPSTSVSCANNSTDCSTFIVIKHYAWLVQWAKWWLTYQVGSVASHSKNMLSLLLLFYYCLYY
jgi:hypothetical protein